MMVGRLNGQVGAVVGLDGVPNAEDAGAPALVGSPLPEPATQPMSDDVMFEIAALLAQSACDDRKHARAARDAAERNIARQVALRVESMREAAEERKTAAIISGTFGMMAGSFGASGGALGLGIQSHSEAFTALGGGASTSMQGTGTFVSAFSTHAAELADARAATHEAAASRAERTSEEATDQMGDARAFMDKVMDFLKEVRSSQSSSAQAAILRG